MNFYQDEEQVFETEDDDESEQLVLDSGELDTLQESAEEAPYNTYFKCSSLSFSNDYSPLATQTVTDLAHFTTSAGEGCVDAKELRKLVQMQTQTLDAETANLLGAMCLALEKANEERNSFESALRRRHLETMHQMSDINQEVEEQISQERERLNRDFRG